MSYRSPREAARSFIACACRRHQPGTVSGLFRHHNSRARNNPQKRPAREADMSGRRNPPPSLDEALVGKHLTPRMLSVVAAAAAEAERRRHTYIGTEHTLLGLLSEPHGIA